MVLKAHGTDLQQLYTVAEFEQLPEFDQRYELLDGKLKEKPMPGFEHSEIADIIRLAVRDFDLLERFGLMRHEVRVKIGQQVLIPDLSYWVSKRRPNRRDLIAAYPDWAIEVQSPGQSWASLEAKAQDYLATGVRLVWLISPAKETVSVLRPGQPVQILEKVGILDGAEVLPGFQLNLTDLFKSEQE